MAAAPAEQRELQLVQSVEFKILGVANKEEKLQQLLQRYLAPLALKAASEHEIVLPVKVLLEQYKATDSAVLKQFDISFIQHSLERIDEHDRRELVPIALRGSSADKGRPRAGPFFRIILRLLLDARIPPRGSQDDEKFRDSIGLSEGADAEYTAEMINLFFRLRIPVGIQTWYEANFTMDKASVDLFRVEDVKAHKIYQRFLELKAKLVSFLASGAFTDMEKLVPAIYAASSFDSRVASAAEEVIKRTSVSMEDPTLVSNLFRAHATLPVPYRIRILGILSKSIHSISMAKDIMDVVTLDLPSSTSPEGQDLALAPASALERNKLHKALFQYLSWVARMGSSLEGFTVGPKLIERLVGFIEYQGWPSPESKNEDEIALRSKAYETIGLLAQSDKNLPAKDRLSLGIWLLQSLSQDRSDESVVSIDGALSSVSANMPLVEGEDSVSLRNMLISSMAPSNDGPPVRSTRHAAVKLCNQCLKFSDVIARWIDILAIGSGQNERSDVIEQGQKGLDPWTYYSEGEATRSFPDWRDMTVMFFGSEITVDKDPFPKSVDDIPEPLASPEIVFRNFGNLNRGAFPIALRYVKLIMFLSALESFKLESNWMDRLETQVRTDIGTRTRIRQYLRSVDSRYWIFFLEACLIGATSESPNVSEESIRSFVDVASLSPRDPLGHLALAGSGLDKLIESNNKEIRTLSSKAFGIVASHPSLSEEAIRQWRDSVTPSFVDGEKCIGPQLNALQGNLLALGHQCSRSVFYGHAVPEGFEFPLRFLVGDSVPPSLRETAFDTFAQLWSAGLAIPPPEGENSIGKVVDVLTAHAKKENERAIFALGRLAVGLGSQQQEGGQQDAAEQPGMLTGGALGRILKELFGLHEIKRTEVQFTVGDAISAAVARWDSDFVKLTLDVEPCNETSLGGVRKELITATLDKLFLDCKGTKPSLLKASGIWLFCIIQYSSDLPEIQSRLREAQAAFMRLLSARDELVQETASRGLSLVYERGDEDLKSTLVKDLVGAFTGTGTQLKVEQDTELFEPGALPTGEGSSVTSYKDIVDLANEVGDQRLVYKFMSLASNAATWSTRSAFGRFGLSTILSDSEVDPKLYPKLFRYRFDPNPNVQRSMDDIWKALVKDPGTVLDENFDDILEDLMGSILGREWRMREASCAAISDLLQSRPFVKYEKRYRDIWNAALKVLDDVKGSVREAALRLCMALSNNLVRQLEEGNDSSAAKAMMKEALPFLLSDRGVESSVKDVQVFATITVMNIAKKGGNALRSFIPDMVPQLLGLLSTIEPEQINYHYQRAGDDSRDQIDKLRSQMVNRSPISEALENCLRFINEDVMVKLVPKLEATIKAAIGMPTKIGCSRVITILFTRHTTDIKPFSGRFLRIMEKHAMEKNDEVSQAYARAAAYIIRVAPDAEKLGFCQRLVKMYLASEEESRRQKIADVVVSLAKISADHFTANETELLPFAYLGMHDTDEYTEKVFKEVWDQHAGSSRTVVRYVQEIVSLVEQCLETTQWALRHTAAFTVGAMVSDVASASEATGEIAEANLRSMWPIFDKVLALKTFPGKEKLLVSYPLLVEKGGALWRNDAQVAAQMRKIAIREAKRNNAEYRVHAFKCLWQFAKARDDLDMLEEIAEIVTPHLEKLRDEDAMEVDTKEELVSATAKNALEAIARGYNRPRMESSPKPVLESIIKLLKPYLGSTKFGAIKRDVWYDSVCEMLKPFASKPSQQGLDAPITTDRDSDGLSLAYLRSLDVEQAEAGVESQRIRRSEALSAVVKARMAGVFGVDGPSLQEFAEEAQTALERERALKPQQAMRTAMKDLREAISREDKDAMAP
ncbi:proteasome component ECM29 [Geosmithia morbida]|uniref:Proteasome component ECM29 n=1 Tax=Geosmithia morbida TaxID=1094350 RepID=A0A9P4Z1J6_9HYPO|nr:proteasome component ECM29 [Geosmithia morbida]KAF4126996.1 proteasome component ECM29 [Geosmithia morbida]